ncbi:MAG TPA: hypothetical protein PLP42_04840 [Acidobacteriota bacterium]|nr:hypothetical protein [Acidobacteriota bacterium]
MLSFWDVLIIVIYLFSSVLVGVLSRGRQRDSQDYFTARGGLAGVVGSILVGLSIASALFSGISFLAYPSVVYGHGPALLLGLFSYLAAWLVLRFWFLPRYLAGPVKHPYQVIETRFGSHARLEASVLFVLLRLGWLATLIFAPALAVMAAGRLEPGWFWPVVLVIGLGSTAYATVGGIRGVIYTDALQFLVITAGLALTVGHVLTHLPTSLATAWSGLAQSGHLDLFDFSFDPSLTFTFWAIAIGFSLSNIATYGGDQMIMQRYLAAGNIRSASRSFTVNALGSSVIILLLSLVGLCLAAWYQAQPDPLLPAKADQVFPYFIATQLPTGVVGLLLAALLAATMSSMAGGINALAGSFTFDFRSSRRDNDDPRRQLRFGRLTSLVLGLAATGIAGVVGSLGSIFEIIQTLLGVFLGPLFACVLLALTTWNISRQGVLIAMPAGVLVGVLLVFSPVSSLWISPATFLTSLGAALGGTMIERVFGPTPLERPVERSSNE